MYLHPVIYVPIYNHFHCEKQTRCYKVFIKISQSNEPTAEKDLAVTSLIDLRNEFMNGIWRRIFMNSRSSLLGLCKEMIQKGCFRFGQGHYLSALYQNIFFFFLGLLQFLKEATVFFRLVQKYFFPIIFKVYTVILHL